MRMLAITAGCLIGMNMAACALDWHIRPTGRADGDGSEANPFPTLQAALKALPGAPDEAMVLKLAPGTYRVASALEITPAHTRGKPLLIDGGGKAVISGGRQLERTIASADDQRWTYPVEDGPVRELFVNGERRSRSRLPKTGWFRVEQALPDKRSGFTAQAGLPPATGAELLFLHDWSISRVPVDSIADRLLKTRGPIGFPAAHYVIDYYEKHPRFCLEDHMEFLTEPGTWCNQRSPARQQIVYIPRVGETDRNTTLEIPVATQLLRVTGTAAQALGDVRLSGLTFEHCRFDLPPSGYAEGQATKHFPRDVAPGGGDPHGQWKFVPWAIEVSYAKQVVFARCRIRNMGGGGILLGPATESCVIENCHIDDISGNGMGIGEGAERKAADGRTWYQAAPSETATSNRISNCLIENCGAQFHGAVGIWVGLAKDSRIIRNEVRQLPYTGISGGWMWNPTPSPCGGNIVEGNHIHHVMQLLSDGGGIYTLGHQPGTILRDNLIHDVPLNAGRAESNGMFLDEGSSGFLIEGNIIHGTDRSPLRFHKAGRLAVTGNQWKLPPNIPPLRFNNTDPALIDAKANSELTPKALAASVAKWIATHPAPVVP